MSRIEPANDHERAANLPQLSAQFDRSLTEDRDPVPLALPSPDRPQRDPRCLNDACQLAIDGGTEYPQRPRAETTQSANMSTRQAAL